ncbi:hypothetical protein HOF92_03690 [bacterium]|jgi:hypothetical protein|nr:hypothetical protein [bacterium]
MIQVEVEIEICRNPIEVFEYISDFSRNPEWQSGMKEAHFLTEGPLRVGTRYAQVAKFLGKRIESVFEVTAFDPGKLVSAKSVEGSFPISFCRTVEPTGAGARVKTLVEGDASGFFKFGGSLLAKMVESAIRKDYKNLKKLLT